MKPPQRRAAQEKEYTLSNASSSTDDNGDRIGESDDGEYQPSSSSSDTSWQEQTSGKKHVSPQATKGSKG